MSELMAEPPVHALVTETTGIIGDIDAELVMLHHGGTLRSEVIV